MSSQCSWLTKDCNPSSLLHSFSSSLFLFSFLFLYLHLPLSFSFSLFFSFYSHFFAFLSLHLSLHLYLSLSLSLTFHLLTYLFPFFLVPLVPRFDLMNEEKVWRNNASILNSWLIFRINVGNTLKLLRVIKFSRKFERTSLNKNNLWQTDDGIIDVNWRWYFFYGYKKKEKFLLKSYSYF